MFEHNFILIIIAAVLAGIAGYLGFSLSRKRTLMAESASTIEKLRQEDQLQQQLRELQSAEVLRQQQDIEQEKARLDEKNKKIWKMSEAALREKHRLEELNGTLNTDKQKLEDEKKKLDEKIKKLWQTSLAIHKEKEKTSELNAMLEEEKHKTEALLRELQVKNKEITDNINYAQRIQQAMLPQNETLSAHFRDYFVLYLPKDIVSGDFYQFAGHDGQLIMVAGDCTGHGVSGALMSMIGGSIVSQIINEKGITDPGQILEELNERIIESLKQQENSFSDGMDVAVCAFKQDFSTLSFAGANRPLWLVRNDDVHIIKPDKLPIGGLQMARERKYTTHHLTLQPGDLVYMFTDGYADQFGGENGKKLMTMRFREILVSMRDLPMNEQRERLLEHINTWKGTHEQVDDILVVGIKINPETQYTPPEKL